MSLRARLIGLLVTLGAVGLLLLGGITYAEQRSFLYARADDQAVEGLRAVQRELGPGPGHGGPRPGHRRGPGGGGGPPISIPPGTYGQRRDSDGEVRASGFFAYGDSTPQPPEIPDDVPTGEFLTVSAADGVRYRLIAERDPLGTTLVAVPLEEVDRTLDRLLLVEALVIAAVLAALALASWWLVRLGLRPLERIGVTAGAIAAGDLSRRVETATPRTEVGRLGIALNEMLARLETAFAEREASEERLRRFLADASHELRTPLSSIRGYAELFRIGAARSEEDTEKAMRRIEQEAARMGLLVEDLLALARLDEVRDVAREEVDLARLASDAVDDARATDPDRPIALRVTGDPAVVLGDRDRLRQVVGNLMRNALVHTPSGTPVDVAVAAAAGWARIDLRDHGPGLPEGVEPRELFERFWRAEGGRVRGKAGAGLGLAIVAGIVEAHGGRVEAADPEGGGARFTVILPTG